MAQITFFQTFFGAGLLYFYWMIWIVSNIACAYFVYQSALRRTAPALNINAYWWALFTLMGGIWALFVYWVMEHSTLVRNAG